MTLTYRPATNTYVQILFFSFVFPEYIPQREITVFYNLFFFFLTLVKYCQTVLQEALFYGTKTLFPHNIILKM